MKYIVIEMPHGGAFSPAAGDHPHPHPERWRCTADQRVEACYAFLDQPGGIYLIECGSPEDLQLLLDETPVLEGAVREVWGIREV